MATEIKINTGDLNSNEYVISWRSAFAGLLVGLLTFALLTALTLAFGGQGLSDGTTGNRAGIFTGVAFIITAMCSTLVGAFFAVRTSHSETKESAFAQSLLVAALVILVLLFEVAMAVSTAGRVAGNALEATAGAVGASAVALGENNMLQNVVEDSLDQRLKLKSSSDVVFRGVTTRLLSGNQEGAKNYLAYQAGISPDEADQKIAAVKAKIDSTLIQARESAASAMKKLGWSLFVAIVLSVGTSLLGGYLAFRAEHQPPSARHRHVGLGKPLQT